MGGVVLITVGTTEFEQLIQIINKSEFYSHLFALGYSKFYIQYGNGETIPLKPPSGLDLVWKSERFYSDFDQILMKSDLVISHAGAGSCLEALTPPLTRKLIIVVNESLMNNHQLELAKSLANRKTALACYPYTLEQLLKQGTLSTEFKQEFSLHSEDIKKLMNYNVNPSKLFSPFEKGNPGKLMDYLDDLFVISSAFSRGKWFPILFWSSSLTAESRRTFSAGNFVRSENKIVSDVDKKKKELWNLYNEVVYPPRDPLVHGPDVKRRPAEITHEHRQVMISRKRAELLAFMISGKTVSEALLQLSYRNGKTERIFEELIREAVELGVKDHSIQFRTKLFVETCRAYRGESVPRLYKGLRSAYYKNSYKYTNLSIRLREITEDDPVYYHRNDLPNAWTPRPTCPSTGSPGWGTTRNMALQHLSRLRSRSLKGGL
ncbi:hypothetical protein Ciccas_005973 [Cichlidogyrus casuarinus]|uniref:UDP-N-acetylglucosamine transferase subunit ALG13 n=1 Tax=Cichlidogyrus casuarinus TaxID=1844966 RepID=A0ABD2QAW2_9PLAT